MIRLFTALAGLALSVSVAGAQWQVPDNTIPIGRGSGQTGFKFNPGVTLDPATGNLATPGSITGAVGIFSSLTLGAALPIASGGTGATSASAARTALGLAIGTNVQAWDADLDAIAALSGTGGLVRTGTGTWALRTITGGSGITVTNGDGVSGNPAVALTVPLTVALGGTNCTAASGTCLDNITGFSGTGLMRRTGAGAYSFGTTVTGAEIATNTVANSNLVQGAAATLKGNPTNATANVSDFTVTGLTAASVCNATLDFLVKYDSATGAFQKASCGLVASAATAGVASIAAATGALSLSSSLSMVGTTLTSVWGLSGSTVSYTGGSVGIGSTSAAIVGFAPAVTISGTATRGALELRSTSTGTSGTAGTIYGLNGSSVLTQIDFAADGATNSGRMDFYTYNAGTFGLRLTFDHLGNTIIPGPVGIGGTPSVAFQVTGTGAAGNTGTTTALLEKHFHGSSGTPVATGVPSISISRYEAISVDTQGGQNAALFVNSIGNNTSVAGVLIAQVAGITVNTTQVGSGDVVAFYGSAIQNGSNVVGRPSFAYGLFLSVAAQNSGNGAFGSELVVANNTGAATSYSAFLGGTQTGTVGYEAATLGSNHATVAFWGRSANGTALWDVGIGFSPGSVITATFQDNSNSVTSLLIGGAHTSGINLSGTFSSYSIQGPGFSMDGSGNFSAASYTASGVAGVSCSGAPTGSFASALGIVTHC